MKTLIVLLAAFIICIVVQAVWHKQINYQHCLRLAMSVMMLLAAAGHFMFPEGMALMIPEFIPYKAELVYITGILEILFAIGLLLPKYYTTTGIVLIIFFILILPANIHAAMQGLDYQKASFDGPDMRYLWFRIPLQIIFIVWTYIGAVRKTT